MPDGSEKRKMGRGKCRHRYKKKTQFFQFYLKEREGIYIGKNRKNRGIKQ